MKLSLLAFPLALVVFAFASLAGETLHPGWQVVDIGAGTKPAFDFGADDSIHVMGMTEAASGVVWHTKAATAQGPWKLITIADGYFYGPGDIRVDQITGETHIAWHDHDAASPQHVVIAPDGGAKSFVIDSDGHDGWDNSLAISPTGSVHLASIDPSGFGATNSLQHGTFDGDSWNFEPAVEGSGSFMYGLNTSIAIDSSGAPYVLYCQSNDWIDDGSLVLASANAPAATAWEFETITSGNAVGRFPTLAIDGNDRLHATWLDVDAENISSGVIQYGMRASEGGAWTIMPVAPLDGVLMGFSDARKSASIALDSVGRPHIAYADTVTINHAVLNDGAWQTTTVLRQTDATYKSLVVLRLDSRDQPGIAFWQSAPDAGGLARPLDTEPSPAIINLDLTVTPNAADTAITYRTVIVGTYQLQWTEGLTTWQPLGDPVVSDGTEIEVKEADSISSVRYYRVQVN